MARRGSGLVRISLSSSVSIRSRAIRCDDQSVINEYGSRPFCRSIQDASGRAATALHSAGITSHAVGNTHATCHMLPGAPAAVPSAPPPSSPWLADAGWRVSENPGGAASHPTADISVGPSRARGVAQNDILSRGLEVYRVSGRCCARGGMMEDRLADRALSPSTHRADRARASAASTRSTVLTEAVDFSARSASDGSRPPSSSSSTRALAISVAEGGSRLGPRCWRTRERNWSRRTRSSGARGGGPRIAEASPRPTQPGISVARRSCGRPLPLRLRRRPQPVASRNIGFNRCREAASVGRCVRRGEARNRVRRTSAPPHRASGRAPARRR
jgi:hypothetical protein